MKLGFFTMPVHPKERPYVETLAEDREAFILADRLGYCEAYCGEHLTDACENIPNSLMFLASLVDATKTIKLGTAVANLPFSHPLIVASNAAMLDNLLKGRLVLGFGAGILRSDAEALEVLDEDRGAMFVEALDQVIALWTGEPPYNLKGKYWNISTEKTLWPEMGIGGVVKPYQKPYPQIVGTVTDRSAEASSRSASAAGVRSPRPICTRTGSITIGRSTRRAAPRADTRQTVPSGASRARSSSPRMITWRSVTARPMPIALTASTCASSRPSWRAVENSGRSSATIR